jgi:ATP-dependent DNA helicase RecG
MDIKAIIQKLIKESETEIVEFKEAKNKYDFNKLGKYFSALSNEANLHREKFAWLIFGVRDHDKAFINTNFRHDSKNLHSLKAEIANHTTNRITFIDIYETRQNNKRIVVFQIPAAPQGIPIAWKGHYYGRDGEELQPLNLEEIERIRAQANLKDWSAEILPNADINDLSKDAIIRARELFIVKNPKLKNEISNWDDITFLNKAKLTIKGKITRTAILLLGKSEVEHYINPASSKITWILKDKNNIEKDYEHFTCPLLLNTQKVFEKIRNLKYRYLPYGTLFPEEINQYDPYIVREALNNCIAHQDYTIGGRIIVIENEDAHLIFINAGKFIPQSIEEVIFSDAPEHRYRNKFLAEAMVNLNMIDTIGSGIRKMFIIQKSKYFPLPEYDLYDDKVKLTITGKILDIKYAVKLAQINDLSLQEIYLLDKVAKHKQLTNTEIRVLRNKKLIEGRKPNFHISESVAKVIDEKAKYIKQRGFDDQYYMDLIIKYLKEFKKASRADFKNLLFNKFPDILTNEKKENKIKNLLQKMKVENKIKLGEGRQWFLDEI